MTSKTGFTNVSVQKFASEGDLALFERNWSEHRELETAIFGGIAMKLTAYRGVTVESWRRD